MVHKKLNRTKGRERTKRRSRVKRTKVKRSTMKQRPNKKTRTTPKIKKRSMRKMKGSNPSRRSYKRIIGGTPKSTRSKGADTYDRHDNPLSIDGPDSREEEWGADLFPGSYGEEEEDEANLFPNTSNYVGREPEEQNSLGDRRRLDKGFQMEMRAKHQDRRNINNRIRDRKNQKQQLRTKLDWNELTDDSFDRFKESGIDWGRKRVNDATSTGLDTVGIVKESASGVSKLIRGTTKTVHDTVKALASWSPKEDFAFKRIKGAFRGAVYTISNKLIRHYLKRFVDKTSPDTGIIDGQPHLTDIGRDRVIRKQLWDSISMEEKTIFMQWIALVKPFFTPFLIGEMKDAEAARPALERYEEGAGVTAHTNDSTADIKLTAKLVKEELLKAVNKINNKSPPTQQQLADAVKMDTMDLKKDLGYEVDPDDEWPKIYDESRKIAVKKVEQSTLSRNEANRKKNINRNKWIKEYLITQIKGDDAYKFRELGVDMDFDELRNYLGYGNKNRLGHGNKNVNEWRKWEQKAMDHVDHRMNLAGDMV